MQKQKTKKAAVTPAPVAENNTPAPVAENAAPVAENAATPATVPAALASVLATLPQMQPTIQPAAPAPAKGKAKGSKVALLRDNRQPDYTRAASVLKAIYGQELTKEESTILAEYAAAQCRKVGNAPVMWADGQTICANWQRYIDSYNWPGAKNPPCAHYTPQPGVQLKGADCIISAGAMCVLAQYALNMPMARAVEIMGKPEITLTGMAETALAVLQEC